ncbi:MULTISPECIES: hypothetical protein [Streptomyces]|uniref:Uncharacterized protein n=1 Tax=Streptomyces lonegramiae TaxID=3075524 RepID=A0ABU2XAF8_9ACTN|nr:hypothetical protein [Streptomyces sp. DSM 41529]MDT0542110.1 hypothetical protein [Streptomyces sp. DSM 41529]
MPDDVGGKPFPDGEEPDDRSHGEANDEFATVVFDEDFVRSAAIHEPTAIERMLAAAQARADAEASRRRTAGVSPEDELYDDGYGPDGEFGYEDDDGDPADGFGHDRDADGAYGPYGRYGSAGRPYRGHARWHRPVAWLLAVLMGIGVVALAFTAVYRGASGNRQNPAPPPASSGVDATPADRPADVPSGRTEPSAPSGSADSDAPVATATAVPPSP